MRKIILPIVECVAVLDSMSLIAYSILFCVFTLFVVLTLIRRFRLGNVEFVVTVVLFLFILWILMHPPQHTETFVAAGEGGGGAAGANQAQSFQRIVWRHFGSLPQYMKSTLSPKLGELVKVMTKGEDSKKNNQEDPDDIHLNEEYFVKHKEDFPELFQKPEVNIDLMMVLKQELEAGSAALNYIKMLNPTKHKQMMVTT